MDTTTIAPARRSQLIEAGRDFGSELTLAQGQKALKGLETHGTKLIAFGFSLEDTQELTDATQALVEAGVGRNGRRTSKRQMNAAYTRTVKEGQQVRLRARSILASARRVLARVAGADAVAGVELIDAVLVSGTVAPDYAIPLAEQLDELRRGLTDATVAAAVANRGGPQTVADLTARAAALRAAEQACAGPLGTPEHTEHLDLLDGIILELVRGAREAAEVASKELGEPALLSAFSLSELYPSTGARTAPDTTPDAPPADA